MTTSTGEVGFNRDSNFWLDAAEFETQASAVMMCPVEELHTPDINRLESVLPLYNGDLLDGFYEDWALRERERVRNLYLSTLAQLMLYYKHHHNFDKSLTYGQQILRLDPLREEVHREVIRLYLANGQRVLAARQYETCCQLLTAELGMPPMEETQALYAQIVPEQSSPSASSQLADLPTTLSQALHHLHCTVQQFQEAQKQLRRATELVEQLSRLHYTKP
jgi:DNA-binding SARP family transcriptional activator